MTVSQVCLERKIVWVWSGHNTVCLVRPVSHCVAIRTLSQCILSTMECCDSCQSHHHYRHLPPLGRYKHLKIKCDHPIGTCHRSLHQLPQPHCAFLCLICSEDVERIPEICPPKSLSKEKWETEDLYGIMEICKISYI